MAGQRPGAFPLLVRGDWGAAEPPPALRKKLLCYFQSQKRSGGGECELRTGTGTGTGHLLVCFARPDVRQRVLDRRVHELDWGPRGRLSLLVTELPADGDAAQEVGRAGGAEAPVNEPQVSLPTCQNKETSVCTQQKTESCEKLEAEKATSSKSVIVVTTASGEEIEDEIVEMYFENKKKSGGGAIESYIKKDQQMIITFQNEEDAQEVLQRKHHSVKKIGLFVKPWQVEDSQESLPSTVVVLENVQETVKDCMLIMLVENISGLSEDDGDFSVEMIPEIHAAVVTFTGNIAAGEFASKLNQNHRAKQQNITARCLELTRRIRAENIPPNTPSDYITIYFESKKNGGAQVVDVQQLPDEDAAIITFSDHKDVTNILAKQHSLDQTPIFVYPYYISLGTALYGKEGPQIKKPDPITVPLDLYIWGYLQRNNRLIEAISCEMAKCNCVLTWPEPRCADPKVTLHPSATLSEQKRLVSRLIKTWNEDVSTAFSHSISKYKAIKCPVSTEVWEAIRNRFTHDEVLIIPCTSKDLVVLIGEKEVVKDVEQELKLLIEEATRDIEREKQRTEEMVVMGPGEYAILQSTGLEEKIHMEFPALQISSTNDHKLINLCGMPEEVYKVKGEILDNIRKMAKKTVNIHPYIFQFLEHIDNETLSQSLFMSKQINAFYELGTEAIILKGSSPEDLLKAEEEIKKELDYKSITLEDESVLQKKEWRMLTKQNCSNGAVTVTQAESQVIIAGCSQAVAKAFEELFNFIDENTQVQKIIGGKPMAVIIFFEKEKTNVWGDLQNRGVKVDFRTQKKCRLIFLSGPRSEVLKGVTLVEQTLSSLHYKRVVIREPGAKSYFKERECFFAALVKQEFKCLVRLEEQSEEQLEEQQEHSNIGKPYRQVTIGGIVIAVYKADLCTHPVDVVVNASNEDLKHIGGLAEALLKAAGPELQQECNELVRKNGNLQPGCAVITSAGKLPCKNVIHAVGPRWRKDEAEKCVCLLRKAVKKSLQLAETYNHRSIALPAISGGIFGFPLQACADSIVSSIKETLEESMGDRSLKEVHLVDDAEETVQVLSETVKQVFTAKSSSPILLTPRSENRKLRENQKEKRKEDLQMARDDLQVVTTNEGLRIRVEEKNIQEATTDVIVNSVGTDLRFGVGPLCKALLETAGQELQVEFDKEKQRQVAGQGSVICTSGYALACKSLLHAILPVWDGGRGQALTTLEGVINFCLMKTEELGLQSIAFPAIGTGGFGFPKPIVSKLMFDVVFKFSSSHSRKTLQEVHFLLNPKDVDNIQAFTVELERRVPESCNAAAPRSSFVRPVSTEILGVHEMQIGSITLQVISGDITKEDTEVIVNISNPTFDATSGVFKAIMDAAGSEVEGECAQYAGQSQSGFITTQGGKLLCSKIIHLIHNNDVKSQVSKVLHECERKMYKSVAFPAIGTGQAGQSPAKVADNMLDAIVEFASKRSVRHLKKIKIVIFQPNMLGDFYKSMKKREDSDSSTTDSWLSLVKSFFLGKNKPTEKKKPVVLEKKVDLATFQICGESQKNVDATESWIKNLILKEQFENIISDELIENFDERQIDALADLQRRKHVTIQLENQLSPPRIKISGISRDVCFVSVEVQKMIQKKKDAEEERSKAELVYNLVEWRYPGSNDSFVAFDKLTNMQLEDAKIAKKPHLTVQINKKNYKVDLNTLQANDDQGKSINIQRVPKNEDKQSIELPAQWEDMQEERVKLVNLKPSCQEYLEVQNKFKKTCPSFVIEKIERIQNPFLWQTYQIKKISLCTKNKNENNEKLLFHGTAASSLNTINYNGFNRGFAGKNAAAIGKGTYFAVDASYSAQDIYSRPDTYGRRHMYLARVLTGQYCVGSGGLITPPPKNAADPTDLYDSVVDNVNNPTMFVIFNDIQAYPEYLITFRK